MSVCKTEETSGSSRYWNQYRSVPDDGKYDVNIIKRIALSQNVF